MSPDDTDRHAAVPSASATDADRYSRFADLIEENPDALLADGFEDAYLGVARRAGGMAVAAYSRPLCIGILMSRDGMTEEDAEEFFEFNTACAWMGDETPVFVEPVGWTLAASDEGA